MRRAFTVILTVMAILGIALIAGKHPYWQSIVVAVPAISAPFLSYFETKRSEELNSHLKTIAANTARPVTPAERNAGLLRKHLRATVVVTNADGSGWAGTTIIAEVTDDDKAKLFHPSGASQPHAWYQAVDCGDLQIEEFAQGSCPLRVKVLKRYGDAVDLGENVTQWEDRFQRKSAPPFPKGDVAHYAAYSKPGSSETRNMRIWTARGGENLFLLEPSTGETAVGDNKEISKRAMLLQIDYAAAGFQRSSAHSGATPYQLFICYFR